MKLPVDTLTASPAETEALGGALAELLRDTRELPRFVALYGDLGVGNTAAWGDYVLENPENLSYGLQRKLEIARALAADPKVLLLDEPAAGLNPREVQELTKLILRIREERGMTILLIEHRLELVMSISEVIYVQDFGQTIAVGSSAEVQQNPEVIRAYLGDEEE